MKKVDLVLRHYNRLKPISCRVVSGDTNNVFTVEIVDNDSKGLEVIKGDPVLIGTLSGEDSLNIVGGSVIGFNYENDMYILCKNDLGALSKDKDRREYERYPTSLTGEIKNQNSINKESLVLKDFSYLGMGAYSTGEFEVEDIVDISIYLSNSVATFDGTIMRKTKSFGRNEYGIQILHRDKNSMIYTQSQLVSLIQNEKNLINKHFINSNSSI